MPEHYSYSMMYSFYEGFNILMYSGAHNTLHCRGTIHRNQLIRIIAGKGQNKY